MPNIIRITTFMHVTNLDEAVTFFTGVLGFALNYRADNYAYVHRESAGIRLLELADAKRSPPASGRCAYYIDVEDVDALYEELKTKLDTLPVGAVHSPEDMDYGQREFLVLAPDGNKIAFGQTIRRGQTHG